MSSNTKLPPPAAAMPDKKHKADPSPPAVSTKAAEPKAASPAKKEEPLDVSNPDKTVIDMDILGQLLEMDDDEEHSFSKPLVQEYLEQADATLDEMEAKIKEGQSKDSLEFLSGKGHFLKGSSAALGAIQVRDSCESLQNLGKEKNAAGSTTLGADEAWKEIETLVPTLKKQHALATKWLKALCSL